MRFPSFYDGLVGKNRRPVEALRRVSFTIEGNPTLARNLRCVKQSPFSVFVDLGPVVLCKS